MRDVAVIIGCSHVNDLGLLRSLGEADIPFVFIKIGEGDEYGILKCKYLKNNICYCINSYINLLQILANVAKIKGRKHIICTNDSSAEFVDKHEVELSKYFITPMRGKAIGIFFDKHEQCKLATKCGLDIPKSVIVTKGSEIYVENLKYPLLTKPLESTQGTKSDIHVCRNYQELCSYLSLDSSCQNYIVQEFIEKDYEVNTVGVRTEDGIIWGGAIKKYRHFPYPTGPGSYAQIFPPSECNINTEGISSFLEEVGYYGLFSAEFVCKDGVNYFMEVNLRNDGLCYVSTCAGINLPAALVKNDSRPSEFPFKSVYMMNLYLDIKNVVAGSVDFFSWIRQFHNTTAFIDYNSSDKLPFCYYIMQNILRITKRLFMPKKRCQLSKNLAI